MIEASSFNIQNVYLSTRKSLPMKAEKTMKGKNAATQSCQAKFGHKASVLCLLLNFTSLRVTPRLISN